MGLRLLVVAVLAAVFPTLHGCTRAPVAGGAAAVATPVPVAAAARATGVPVVARAAAVATPVCAGGVCALPVAPRIPVPDAPGKDDVPSTAILGAGSTTRNGRGK